MGLILISIFPRFLHLHRICESTSTKFINDTTPHSCHFSYKTAFRYWCDKFYKLQLPYLLNLLYYWPWLENKAAYCWWMDKLNLIHSCYEQCNPLLSKQHKFCMWPWWACFQNKVLPHMCKGTSPQYRFIFNRWIQTIGPNPEKCHVPSMSLPVI